jgi:hypothetical protein
MRQFRIMMTFLESSVITYSTHSIKLESATVFGKIAFALIIFLIAGCSCGGKDPCEATQDQTNHFRDQDDLMKDTPDRQILRSSDPDTALAIFMFKNYTLDSVETNLFEYKRYFHEKQKIDSLITKLYMTDSLLDEKLESLETVEMRIRGYCLNSLDYEYQFLNEPCINFLVYVRDSSVLRYLNEYKTRGKLTVRELSYVEKQIEKYK